MQCLPQQVTAQPQWIIGIEDRLGIGSMSFRRARQHGDRAAQRVDCFAW